METITINDDKYYIVTKLDECQIVGFFHNAWHLINSNNGKGALLLQIESGKLQAGIIVDHDNDEFQHVSWCPLFKDFTH